MQKLMVLLEEVERENMVLSAEVRELRPLKVEAEELNTTIEELVGEYSRLAAEGELTRSATATMAADLRHENVVLRNRLQALEHSVSEMAERAVESSSCSIPVHKLAGAG